MAPAKDPTEPIRLRASRYPGVDEGTACTQSSFKAGKKAFLFIGMAKGRYKAMFKLKDSMPEAVKLARKHPDRFEAGTVGWVTARFTAEEPMPKKVWEKWLDESYELSVAAKRSTKKKVAKKKPVKKSAKKATPKRKATKTTVSEKPTRKTKKTSTKKTSKKTVTKKATKKTSKKAGGKARR